MTAKNEVPEYVKKWALGIITTLLTVGIVSWVRLNFVPAEKFESHIREFSDVNIERAEIRSELRYVGERLAETTASLRENALSLERLNENVIRLIDRDERGTRQ